MSEDRKPLEETWYWYTIVSVIMVPTTAWFYYLMITGNWLHIVSTSTVPFWMLWGILAVLSGVGVLMTILAIGSPYTAWKYWKVRN